MEIITLKGERREPHGSRAAARLRRRGLIPGIVYGHQKPADAVAIDRQEVERYVERGAHLVRLQFDGQSETCLIKEVQFDAVGLQAIHIDLTRVDLTERVRVKVPIELRGTAKGAAEGGVVNQQLMELEVECVVTAIPSSIRVPLADLGLNQMLHVRELVLPEGVRAMNEPESIVAICREHLVEVAPVEAPVEGAAEPEVIEKGKKEAEPEEEAPPAKEKDKEKK
jgi:large subunit ribosomal protein L25